MNTNFPFIPDPNLMSMNFSNKINEIEQSIRRIDRELKRLESRVNRLENEKKSYSTIIENNNYNDDDGMYMM